MSKSDALTFLKLRAEENRAQADKLRQRAQRLGEERENVERAALQDMMDANVLEAEASLIDAMVREGAKKQASMGPDLGPALTYLSEQGLSESDKAVLATMSAVANAAMVEVTWDYLCEATGLGVVGLHESIVTLERLGWINEVTDGAGEKVGRWLILERREIAA